MTEVSRKNETIIDCELRRRRVTDTDLSGSGKKAEALRELNCGYVLTDSVSTLKDV